MKEFLGHIFDFTSEELKAALFIGVFLVFIGTVICVMFAKEINQFFHFMGL
jgi:hypothetical protein